MKQLGNILSGEKLISPQNMVRTHVGASYAAVMQAKKVEIHPSDLF